MVLTIENNQLTILIVIIILSLGVGMVVGYGGTSPSEMGHTIGEIEGLDLEAQVPSGFCIFTAQSSVAQDGCPDGWIRADELDGRTIRGSGAGNVGDTGGQHDIYTGVDRKKSSSSGSHVADNSFHTNWPPYRKVLVCCKE